MDQSGQVRCQAAAMKTLPYCTDAQMRLFDREEAILRVLSYQEQGHTSQAEAFAPVFIAAYKDCTDVPKRQGRLITR